MAQSVAVTPALQLAALTAFSVAGASSHPCPTGRQVPLPPPCPNFDSPAKLGYIPRPGADSIVTLFTAVNTVVTRVMTLQCIQACWHATVLV